MESLDVSHCLLLPSHFLLLQTTPNECHNFSFVVVQFHVHTRTLEPTLFIEGMYITRLHLLEVSRTEEFLPSFLLKW